MIGPLTDPAAHGGDPADSFDVVLISLPGYGFSSPLTETGWNWWHTADLENTLMKDVLGYEKYATAGGDWGALVAQQHGHKYEQDVYRHLHPLPGPDEPLPAGASRTSRPTSSSTRCSALPAASEYGEGEEGWFERGKLFVENESGYGEIQLTKPQTLAALVADSPAGQLAWITEKRYFWGLAERGVGTEAFERVWPKEDLVTTAAVYFLTNTGGTSSRYYWECRNNPWKPSHDRFPVVGAPTAVGIYPGEIYKPPDQVDREVLQPAAVPRARRRRPLRAPRGAGHLRGRRSHVLPTVPLTGAAGRSADPLTTVTTAGVDRTSLHGRPRLPVPEA